MLKHHYRTLKNYHLAFLLKYSFCTFVFILLFVLTHGISQAQNNNTVPGKLDERFIIRNESISSHLNQSYYYPEETIWFSLKINKISPESVSSKVVYVDIFSEEKKNVFSGTYLFKNSSSSGSWKIPKNMEEGKYVLRAYTNWMRNFDDSTFSYTEFKILPLDKVPNVNIASTYFENKYLKVEKSKFGKNRLYTLRNKGMHELHFFNSSNKSKFFKSTT